MVAGPLEVQTAQLAGGATNADRVFVTSRSVIVLDGATAFEPTRVGADEYAERLGIETAERIDEADTSVSDVVAGAIDRTARALELRSGRAPSSTIAIFRLRPSAEVDLYALGDSSIHYGRGTAETTLTDNRIDCIAPVERQGYLDHLRAGDGYGPAHRARLVELQRAQRTARNTSAGYWIAEADPGAAAQAFERSLPAGSIAWAVLATDGASEGIDAEGLPWSAVAGYDRDQLQRLLAELHRWEATADPDGQARPRPKRHDDKTLATVRLGV